MSYDKLKNSIIRGQNNEYPWIPIGMEKMGKHLGIGKRLYHLIGGDPGTGKTSFVDQNYVLKPYDWYKNKPEDNDTNLLIHYFSMERSKENKYAKWLALRLWMDHSILLDVPTIMGWGTAKRPLEDHELELIDEYKEYFSEMETIITVQDGVNNPTGVYKQLVDLALLHGNEYRRDSEGHLFKRDREKFITGEPEWINISDETGLPKEVAELERYDGIYIPYDPKLIILFVIDHLGKVRHESGLNDKGTLDKMSAYIQIARDHYGMCGIGINQFNRNNSNIMRRVNTDMSPEKSDFKGSGNMYEDADVVIGLFNPFEFGISSYLKYKVNKLVNDEGYNRFRSSSILKNTYGIDNAAFGCQFIGECGFYKELPKAGDMTEQLYSETVYPAGIIN